MATTQYEQLGELYLETLCQNAYYDGAAGTIRDAVLLALSGDNKTEAAIGSLDAAQKLTHDAMGFLERAVSHVSRDCEDNRCDWARIDAFWDGTDRSDIAWVIQELEQQSGNAWRLSFHGDGKSQRLSLKTRHDLNVASVFLSAAALLLKEVQDDG
ncbi:MAG: hypothetical protein RLZZ216_818 [Cyanobacteriota bacterium]|jgi:hypothetical protein